MARLANSAARAVLCAEGVGDDAEGRARNVWVVCVGRVSLAVSLGAIVVVVEGSGIGSSRGGGEGGSASAISFSK